MYNTGSDAGTAGYYDPSGYSEDNSDMRYKTNTTGYSKSINKHKHGGPTLGRPADYFLDDDGFVLFPDGSKYKGGL